MKFSTTIVSTYLLFAGVCACSEPTSNNEENVLQLPEQAERTIACGELNVRLIALEANTSIEFASFGVAQANSTILKSLSQAESKKILDECIIPAWRNPQ